MIFVYRANSESIRYLAHYNMINSLLNGYKKNQFLTRLIVIYKYKILMCDCLCRTRTYHPFPTSSAKSTRKTCIYIRPQKPYETHKWHIRSSSPSFVNYSQYGSYAGRYDSRGSAKRY